MISRIKRMKYATGLFMTESEFDTDQQYHMSMRRLHNRRMHTPGIVWGLDLVPTINSHLVDIEPGMAPDVYYDETLSQELSCEIVLAATLQLDISQGQYGAGEAVYIWVQYYEESADASSNGGGLPIHWLESCYAGHAKASPDGSPPLELQDEERYILLGKLILNQEGKIDSLELEFNGIPIRRYAGFMSKSIETDRLVLNDEEISEDFPYLDGKLLQGDTPGIEVHSALTQMSGDLEVGGSAKVQGSISSGGDILFPDEKGIVVNVDNQPTASLRYSNDQGRWLAGGVDLTEKLAYLSEVQSFIPAGLMSDFTGKAAPAGWIFASGRTIGNANSGATERAHNDTWRLFYLYWNDYIDSELPIKDNMGAPQLRTNYVNAKLAFDAGCRITLPDLRGRVAAGRDDMGGDAAGRVTSGRSGIAGTKLLAGGGAESVSLTVAQMPAHSHGTTISGDVHNHTVNVEWHSLAPGSHGLWAPDNIIYSATVGSSNYTHSHTATIGNTGLSQAHGTFSHLLL